MLESDSFINLIISETGKRFRYGIRKLANRKAISRESRLFSEAGRYFNDGNLDAAVEYYSQVKLDPYYSQMAEKMLGWIAFLNGRLEKGWPFYPVTSIDRVPMIEFLTGYLKFFASGSVRVHKAARPWELRCLLKLTPWEQNCQPRRGMLVWFNFGSSIGGEILCGKLLGKFSELHSGMRITCAVDPRLLEIFRGTYPAINFISKRDSLSPKRMKFDYYLLGRDLLGLIVNKEADFQALKKQRMTPYGSPIPWKGPQDAFKVAISWKTTNAEQGKYRNIPLELLVSVLRKFPFAYCSAQHGITDEEKSCLAGELGGRIDFDFFRPSGSLNDFCLRLQQMDLVLSIDNSTMHMAGCIGVKTLGLLSIPSYWAYPLSGEDSRWYDSVCLIRQSVPGDWQATIEELDNKLEAIYKTCAFYTSTTS